MRESPTYRLELEAINARFGGKAHLSVTEVAEYLGHEPKWVRQHLHLDKHGTTAVNLAYILSHWNS